MEGHDDSTKADRPGPSPRDRALFFDRRVTLDLTREDHRALKMAALEADTTMAELLRALVALWRQDSHLARRVNPRCLGKYSLIYRDNEASHAPPATEQ